MTRHITPLRVLVAWAILVHGPAVLVSGPIWDDWIIFNRLLDSDWERLWRLFADQGGPLFYLPHRLLLSLPASTLGYRLAFLSCVVVFAGALFSLLRQALEFEEGPAAVLAALVVTYPVTFGAGFLAITMPYSLALASFVSGWAIVFSVSGTDRSVWVRGTARIVGALLIFCSYSHKSLLVLNAAPVALLFLRISPHGPLGARARAFGAYWLLACLPAVFWVTVHLAFPPTGAQQDYNALQFRLGLSGLPTAAAISLHVLVFDSLNAALSALTQKPALLFAAVLCALSMPRSIWAPNARYRRLHLAWFAAVSVSLAILPYAAVNKSPSLDNWELRHAMLGGLPVALALALLLERVVPEHTGRILAFLIFACGAWNFDNYVQTQTDVVRGQALAAALSRNGDFRRSSVAWLHDRTSHSHPRNLSFTLHWGGIMWAATGQQGYLVLDDRHYAPDRMNWPLEEKLFTAQYGLEGASPTGCVVDVTVKDGPSRLSEFQIATRSVLYRLAAPERLRALKGELVSIDVVPGEGCAP